MFQLRATDINTQITCSKNVYIFLVKDFPTERRGNMFHGNINLHMSINKYDFLFIQCKFS